MSVPVWGSHALGVYLTFVAKFKYLENLEVYISLDKNAFWRLCTSLVNSFGLFGPVWA